MRLRAGQGRRKRLAQSRNFRCWILVRSQHNEYPLFFFGETQSPNAPEIVEKAMSYGKAEVRRRQIFSWQRLLRRGLPVGSS